MPARRRGALVRDLHNTSIEIDAKKAAVQAALGNLAGLQENVDKVSELITEADKDKEERIGKVTKDIDMHELKAVEVALMKHNKVPVDAFEIQQLKRLEKDAENDMQKKRQKLNTEVAEKVAAEVRFKELQFAEQFAEMQAKEMAFQAERKTLLETVEALRGEIESQKKLTGDIAKAAAQPPPIQQIVRPSGM